MEEEDDIRAAAPTTLTDAELRALSYFAVGVGSEGSVGGRDVSNRLSFAGTIRNGVMDPVGNSGYSIGTLQTDLGQHPEVATSLVNAYQGWARANHPDWVLTEAQETQTASDLGRNGRTIDAQNGRPIDATVKAHLDAFLASDAGITFVHDRDVAQVNTLMRPGGAMDQLQGTTLYQNASLDDQARLATVVLKLENQSGRAYYPRIINGINNGTIDSVEDARNTVDGLMANRNGRPDYIESGMDHALEGAEVFNRLRNADPRSPIHTSWQSVSANPLVNPTHTHQDAAHPNLSSEYTVVKGLFLQKDNAPALIEALDLGGAYGYNITNHRGQIRPQSTSLYAAGDDFLVLDGRGIGKAYVAGAWSDVDRTYLTRVNHPDGTVDLNIDRDGTVERLLHVDPNAPVLRPAQQPVEPTQPASTEQQDWGPFTPNQAPVMAPAIVPRGIGGVWGASDEDRAPSNAMPGSGPIDPPLTNPALTLSPLISASDARDRDDPDVQPLPARALADQPGNPGFRDFDLIRTTTLACERWSPEQAHNIAAALLKAHTEDPVCKRLDQCVVGNLTAKGDVNVFAVYSPFGAQGPNFWTHVNGDQAAQEPAQRNLEQVEQIKQQQAQELAQQQTQQLNNPSQRSSHLSI